MHITLRPTDPDDPQAQFCLSQYFALLQTRIPNLPPGLFPLPDPSAPDYRPPTGSFLLAMSGEVPLGCVSLRPHTATTAARIAEVKRLWIAPQARGQGLARRLMHAIEDEARSLGYSALILDTNEHLPEAIALYTHSGWQRVAAYSPPPATHWFGKSLQDRDSLHDPAAPWCCINRCPNRAFRIKPAQHPKLGD